MSRFLPVVVAIVAILGLTVVQSLMSDRFVSTNVTAEQRAQLLENVKMDIGDWKGENLKVTEEVRDTAGAVGCISRLYTNQRTGQVVKLWLVVGHAKHISNHTPNICYKGAGFTMRSDDSSLYTFVYEGQDGQKANAKFWTNTFTKEDTMGRQLERVFWSWYNPKPGAPVVWQAESDPNGTFGNTRALFKMYFASQMGDMNETTEESAAKMFGVEFLPHIERVLSESGIRAPGDTTEAAATTAAAAQ